MYVYRLERNGLGPFVTKNTNLSSNRKINIKRAFKHPILYKNYNDELINKNRELAHSCNGYLFGCHSRKNLKRYFNGNLKPLFKQGFRVKIYRVPDEEIIDIGIELAFPVKYHKFQSIKKLNKVCQRDKLNYGINYVTTKK